MKRRVIQRRVVVFLLLLLAGGAIVNVAVAWTIAWFDSGDLRANTVSTSHPYERNGNWWITMKGVGPATTFVASRPFASQARANEFIDFFDGRLTLVDTEPANWGNKAGQARILIPQPST